jgi:glycine cleavage system H protein
LGDIVYVDITEEGNEVTAGTVFGSVEAVKTVSDLFMPITGEIVEVNSKLDNAPELVNKDPYGDGWMIKIKIKNMADVDKMLDTKGYKVLVGA